MATLSILGYNLPQGLTLTKTTSVTMASNAATGQQDQSGNSSKTFSKITVQNVLGDNNGNSINISNNNNGPNSSHVSANNTNTIVRKMKDFGMIGAVNNAGTTNHGSSTKNLIIRKRPLMEAKNNASKTTTTSKKPPKQPKDNATPKTAKKPANENQHPPKKLSQSALNGMSLPPTKPAGTPGRKGLPLPQAVARRNARERNRVKQVNNGFAALRERIPEEVAEAFESQAPARGTSVKKLSKVETLRMAVEYIRSLERLLGFDFTSTQQSSCSSGEDSYSMIKDEFDTLSPSMDDNFEDSLNNYDVDDFFAATQADNSSLTTTALGDVSNAEINPLDLLPNITTLNGLQYIRIPGTNTYQLLTPDIFVGNTHSPPNSSLDDEQFNALIDTNRLSPTTMSTTNMEDPQTAMPTTINATTATVTATATATAPVSPNMATTITTAIANTELLKNGERVSNAAVPLSCLSRSPVPRVQPAMTKTTATATSSSSPDAGLPSLYEPPQQPAILLSPAANTNERCLQTCATNANALQRAFVTPNLTHALIKQEYTEALDFVSTTTAATSTTSPSATTVINVYQTAIATGNPKLIQSELLGGHATISMSPPLDRCNRVLVTSAPTLPHHELHSFYDQDDSGSFYESNLSFKKDLDDVLLDASTANNTGLSDESMIEAIDWWEAHTPQSDGGGSVML